MRGDNLFRGKEEDAVRALRAGMAKEKERRAQPGMAVPLILKTQEKMIGRKKKEHSQEWLCH
jgi:hypothetical protein